ncbi:hypothetical protein [Candidatus Protochlamydia phocaeensis]|uniref:hypothetical protein n=1 Tax=Candidatus Protochlamydia phocaeensis TaxID=1414722 RepID=UPI000838231B|nr:hypothetical protein [Candidatus Protochlamydia phocaeensis]
MQKNSFLSQSLLSIFLFASCLPLTSCSIYSNSDVAMNDVDAYPYPSSPPVDYSYSYSYNENEYPYEYQDTYRTSRSTAGHYQYDSSGRKFGNMTYYNGYYNTTYNPGDFTSGISSYPGTSTGPGVDNGYNATPNGIYNTLDPVTGRYHPRRN